MRRKCSDYPGLFPGKSFQALVDAETQKAFRVEMTELWVQRDEDSNISSASREEHWKGKAAQGDSSRYLEKVLPESWTNCDQCRPERKLSRTRERTTQKEKEAVFEAPKGMGLACLPVCIPTGQNRKTSQSLVEYSEGCCLSSWAKFNLMFTLVLPNKA